MKIWKKWIRTVVEGLKTGEVNTVTDTWSYAVSKQYFEPLGIPINTRISWDEDTVNTELLETLFLLPTNKNRPFPIVGSTIVGPTAGTVYQVDAQNYTLLVNSKQTM